MARVTRAACVGSLLAATSAQAQVSVDADNRYPSVGAIMVWRMEGGQPVEMRGFVSGMSSDDVENQEGNEALAGALAVAE